MFMQERLKKLEPIQFIALGGFTLCIIATLCNILIESKWMYYTFIPNSKIVVIENIKLYAMLHKHNLLKDFMKMIE